MVRFREWPRRPDPVKAGLIARRRAFKFRTDGERNVSEDVSPVLCVEPHKPLKINRWQKLARRKTARQWRKFASLTGLEQQAVIPVIIFYIFTHHEALAPESIDKCMNFILTRTIL